jgi:hypothetical protein
MSETCSICGKSFTDKSWDNRHTDPRDGSDCHASCCPTCKGRKAPSPTESTPPSGAGAGSAQGAGCVWHISDVASDVWEASCGSLFDRWTYPAARDGMKYCPYCGKMLVVGVEGKTKREIDIADAAEKAAKGQ